MGLMDELKQEIKNTGTSKGKFLYTKDGSKIRVRFLQEIDDGYKIPWHDSYELGVDVPCQEVFGRECKYCGDDDLRTRNTYAWSVYDYESEKVKIFNKALTAVGKLVEKLRCRGVVFLFINASVPPKNFF